MAMYNGHTRNTNFLRICHCLPLPDVVLLVVISISSLYKGKENGLSNVHCVLGESLSQHLMRLLLSNDYTFTFSFDWSDFLHNDHVNRFW